jgi:hypothetical protein
LHPPCGGRPSLFALLSLSLFSSFSVSHGKTDGWWQALQSEVDNDDFAFHSDWWRGHGQKIEQGNKLLEAYWSVPVKKIRLQVGKETADIALDASIAGKLTLRQLTSLPGLTCSTPVGSLHKFLEKEKRHRKLVCGKSTVNLFHENEDGLKFKARLGFLAFDDNVKHHKVANFEHKMLKTAGLKAPSLQKAFCKKPNMLFGLGLKAAFPHTCARKLNPFCKRYAGRGKMCVACVSQFRLHCKDTSAMHQYCFHSAPKNTDTATAAAPTRHHTSADDGFRRRLRVSVDQAEAASATDQESMGKNNGKQMSVSSGSITAVHHCKHLAGSKACMQSFRRNFEPTKIWVYGANPAEYAQSEKFALAIQSETDKHHLDYDS